MRTLAYVVAQVGKRSFGILPSTEATLGLMLALPVRTRVELGRAIPSGAPLLEATLQGGPP